MILAPHDPALVDAALHGDADAWERLVRAWLPVVHGWCSRLGGPRVDPQDAVQDVFIVVFLRLGSLRDPDCFPSWICEVTRRVLYRHRKRAWLQRWVPGWPQRTQRPVLQGGPEEEREQLELHEAIHQVLDQLPTEQREALVLCDVEERSSPEVALLLGLSENTVRSRLRLGRARFRRLARGKTDLKELVEAMDGKVR